MIHTIDEITDALYSAALRLDAEEMERLYVELRKHGDTRSRALELRYRGLLAYNRGLYRVALPYYEKALSLFTEVGDLPRIATCTMDIGLVYSALGETTTATTMLNNVRVQYESLGDVTAANLARMNLAIVLDEAGDLVGALEQYKSLLGDIDQSDLGYRARLLQNIAAVYSDLGEYTEVLEFANKSLEHYSHIGDIGGIVDVSIIIGHLFTTFGDYVLAMEYFDRAVVACERADFPIGRAQALHAKSRVYSSLSDFATAEVLLREALGLLEDNGKDKLHNLLLRSLAINMRSMQQEDAAIELFDVLIGEYKDPSSVHLLNDIIYHKVQCLIQAGRIGLARLAFDTRLSASTDNLWNSITALYTEASLLDSEGQYSEAYALAIAALERVRDHQMGDVEATILQILMKITQHLNDFPSYIRYSELEREVNNKLRSHTTTTRIALLAREREIQTEREQRNRERELLYSTLPQNIADRMTRGEEVTGDHFENAAIAFFDIVGFTSNTSDMPPSVVVKLLENIYRAIDAICDKYHVIKIKTIGDSYMCFRGDADAYTNAMSIASVATDVLNRIFTWPNDQPLMFRSGVHIGPATAGVIGAQRLQYDVWGDTVNVASRMESTSLPGKIQISEAFAALLPATSSGDSVERPMQVVERGEIEIKGKGMMKTYWLEGL